jgi:NAD(P)H-dependent flavin oxidoreductase YrpB (nitropropane dioxygenase family)
MKTVITEMFGIKHPIIQGGMHYVGFSELASAVSNAGGLGMITGLTQRTPASGKGNCKMSRHDVQAIRRELDISPRIHGAALSRIYRGYPGRWGEGC